MIKILTTKGEQINWKREPGQTIGQAVKAFQAATGKTVKIANS